MYLSLSSELKRSYLWRTYGSGGLLCHLIVGIQFQVIVKELGYTNVEHSTPCAFQLASHWNLDIWDTHISKVPYIAVEQYIIT